jgi:hypothetical protein
LFTTFSFTFLDHRVPNQRNQTAHASGCADNESTYCCSFPTAGDGADDGTHSGGNAGTLDRLRGPVGALRATFVVNLDRVAIQRSNALDNSREPVSLSIRQPDHFERERCALSRGSSLLAESNLKVPVRRLAPCIRIVKTNFVSNSARCCTRSPGGLDSSAMLTNRSWCSL